MYYNCIKHLIKKYGTFNKVKLDYWTSLSKHNTNKKIDQNITLSDTGVQSRYQSTPPYNMQVPYSALIAVANNFPTDISMVHSLDTNIKFLKFNDPLGKESFWRSSAFILGGVIEECFGSQNYMCQVTDHGFYCDSYIANKNITPDDFPMMENKFNDIVSSKTVLERIDIDIDTAKSIFGDNPLKMVYLESLSQGNNHVALYKCGNIIDICQSPLVVHSGQLKCLKLIGNGSVRNPLKENENSLQRIYGISFPKKDQLKAWIADQEVAKKRDHRRIGLEQNLFFFHNSSTGSPFMLPAGTHICNKLIDLIREQYWCRGFQEVTTPNIFDCDLWKTSGHWDLYQENLFKIPLENDEVMSLKPMNCPAHCLIYKHEERSFRDLPLRFADFGALHRNESSGALTGLTRLRKFHQDDAHIFCRPDQVEEEIKSSLDFLQHIYTILGFKYSLTLSTRPQRFLGDESMWDSAEEQLKTCLEHTGRDWTLNPGDGAFYGPKIDITITDAMNRDHQCATIQLDFQLPIRFDLKYTIDKASNTDARPVIIHRAILGSVERLLAIMIESNAGKWPFWLNPRQVLVVPVSRQFTEYAENVRDRIRTGGFMCDANVSVDCTLNKKIVLGQKQRYSCIVVVGEREAATGTVSVRMRDNDDKASLTISDFLDKLTHWQNTRAATMDHNEP